MPLTVDYGAARMYLRTINPGMIPTQGTHIAEAIELAMQGFVTGDSSHKALIIITDGEDNEGGVEEKISEAAKQGIKIYTIGVGSENGAPIPEGTDYKRDEDGSIVLSKLNSQMLDEIARKGHGKFMVLGSGNEQVDELLNELKGIETKEFEEMVFTDFNDYYQWCVAIAVVLLLIEWWLSERKTRLTLKFLRSE
jgi:Ca-activated chloride channel family protein